MTQTQTQILDGEHVAGSGQQSHAVPVELWRVVLIRDGGHSGTEVYRVEDGYRFVSLDRRTVATAERCVLVHLGAGAQDEIQEPYGCDLDGGLALIGLDLDDDATEYGEVLWDSAA